MALQTSGIISLSQIASELGVPASSTLAYMVSVANTSLNKVAPHKLSEWYGYVGTPPATLTSISLSQYAFSSTLQSFNAAIRTNTAPYGRTLKIHLKLVRDGANPATYYDGIVYSGVAPQTSTSWLTGNMDVNLDYLWDNRTIGSEYNITAYYTAYFADAPAIKKVVKKVFIRSAPITTTTT